MFFNSAEREEELKKTQDQAEADKKAANKRRTDELMESYYLEQKEQELIQNALEEQYVLNRKKLYTMAHYDRTRVQTDVEVERVPGGWIFYRSAETKDGTGTSTFVPFAEEKIEMFYKLKNG